MDFLGIFSHPVGKWWRRVPEVLAEFMEDELGVRPEGRRPAF
jgi:hypothetical protein